jgi:hypothetical protein
MLPDRWIAKIGILLLGEHGRLYLQSIWRDGVRTMGRIWDAAFSEQVG